MLSHRNLVSNLVSTSKAHKLGYQHRALSFLPLCHVYERMMNYRMQYKGISIYYAESLGSISRDLKDVKPHIFNTVPRLLEKVYDTILGKGKNLPYIKKVIFFWAVRLGLRYRDNKELVSHPDVIARYQKEVNKYNQELGDTEKIQRFRLVCEEWSPDTGELSFTQKLKRDVIYDKYRNLIDEIYQVPGKKNGHHLIELHRKTVKGLKEGLKQGLDSMRKNVPRI
ncbi:MAG: AMP-binding protein [Bacteroidales bacterium]|nr:AMP-binding protein [Bacteroidales bacterium]